MAPIVVVHYHEVALKGRNRQFFVDRLLRNLRQATVGLGVRRIRNAHGGVALELGDRSDWPMIRSAIESVFGVANFALGETCPPDLEAIKQTAMRLVEGLNPADFRIDTHRGDKSFPIKSDEVNREVGAFVQHQTGWRVRLKNPELTIWIEILPREAIVYRVKLPGPGGLPVGTGGRVVTLLSGGIDSPVAAYRMMKRGCEVVFVHFHAYPFLNESSIEKAVELGRMLNRYQFTSRLYLIPFGETQREIVLGAPAPYRTILYRRLMMRIAANIAEREGAPALVTGESLGQVASQTLENMTVIDRAVPMPILRPLVGMDKSEIIREAQQIGTYAISITPDQDCCQLFMPRRPATRATLADIEAAESQLDLDRLVALALEDVDVVEFTREGMVKRSVSLLEAQAAKVEA